MNTYAGQKIAILGISLEGIDCVKFFAQNGADITCCDMREIGQLKEALDLLGGYKVRYQLGQKYLENLEIYDLVVRTPGMSPRLPQLQKLKKMGKEMTSLTKLFFKHCQAPIVGVTGTKGKGTTCSLIAQMLKAGQNKVYLGGNIGIPLLSQVGDIDKSAIVVLELSSFQLEDLKTSPHVAVVLRVTQEHLKNFDKLATNFHTTRADYVKAKQSIVRFQGPGDFVVLNRDDKTSASFGNLTPAKLFFFSGQTTQADAYVEDDSVYLKSHGRREKICALGKIFLRGRHNLENIAASSIVAQIFDVPLEKIREVVRKFKGLPHRLELAGQVRAVKYYDDSFSTVPETTIAAVKSFHEPLILILGGSDKGSDYDQMGREIAKAQVRAAIVIGDMTERITASLKQAGFMGSVITGCKNMTEILKCAQKLATPGDVVLLSPACASFDMFNNYKDRGEQFKYAVEYSQTFPKQK